MIGAIAAGFLGAFPLWMLLLGLLIGYLRGRETHRGRSAQFLASETIFWAIGISGIWGFIFHVFFQPVAARSIGWAPGGFEYEVGFANLAFGVLGVMSRWRTLEFAWATVIGSSIFLLLAAVNHVAQIIAAHNVAPGNAGVILWTDIFIPIIAILLLSRAQRYARTL